MRPWEPLSLKGPGIGSCRLQTALGALDDLSLLFHRNLFSRLEDTILPPFPLRFFTHAVLCLVAQSCPTLCDPVNCSLPGSSIHGDSPGKNTGVGYHALPQGVFPTQGSNPGLLHCRWILYWATREASSPVSNYYTQQQLSLSFVHCKILHLHVHVYSHMHTHVWCSTHVPVHLHTKNFCSSDKSKIWNGMLTYVIWITGVTSCWFCWVPFNSGSEAGCVYWDSFLRQGTPPGAWEALIPLLLTPPNAPTPSNAKSLLTTEKIFLLFNIRKMFMENTQKR